MLAWDYFIAVHGALRKGVTLKSQEYFDGAVEAFGRGRVDPVLRKREISTSEPFIPGELIAPHISGVAVVDYGENISGVSTFDITSSVFGGKVKANYKTARFEWVQGMTRPVPNVMRNFPMGFKTPSQINDESERALMDFLRERFVPGQNYALTTTGMRVSGLEWLFVDMHGKHKVVQNYLGTGAGIEVIGKVDDDHSRTGFSLPFPKNKHCPYDNSRLRFMEYGQNQQNHDGFAFRIYRCGGCNHSFSQKTPEKERQRQNERWEKQQRTIVYRAAQEA